MRDNENALVQTNKNSLRKGELSQVLNALSRYLCYKYDLAKDNREREFYLGYLARVKLYLIMMEEVEHDGKKLPYKRLVTSPAIQEEKENENL